MNYEYRTVRAKRSATAVHFYFVERRRIFNLLSMKINFKWRELGNVHMWGVFVRKDFNTPDEASIFIQEQEGLIMEVGE